MVIAMCFGLRSCLFIMSAVQLLSQSNVESVKERLVSSCFYNNYICLVLTLTAADVRSLISDIMMSMIIMMKVIMMLIVMMTVTQDSCDPLGLHVPGAVDLSYDDGDDNDAGIMWPTGPTCV